MDAVLFWKDTEFVRNHSADFYEISILRLTFPIVDCCLKNSFTFHSFIHCMKAFITFV